MSSNLGQIEQMTTDLAAFERLKFAVSTFFSVTIDPIPFKRAGHYILNEFEFWPDWTTDYRVR